MICSRAVYHCLPPKTIVLVMSSMRSGSTLLKALLAQAEDISHLPEIDYTQYGSNSYYLYQKAYFLSKKRIIVLKYPGVAVKLAPGLDRIKVIVLVRDTYGVVQSLEKRNKDTELKTRTKTDWVNYWCRIYQMILDAVGAINTNLCFVRYEDLLKDPKAATKKIFAFVGSQQTEGVERYQEPQNYRWEWGKDDGSEKIKALQIVPEHPGGKEMDHELQGIIENSHDARSLREKLGYLRNNSIANQKLMKFFV